MSNQGRALSNTVLLTGSGRSGTTWLANIIAANPNFRIIFEPFDYRRVPEARGMPLMPYMRPDESYPEWEAYLSQVMKGRIHNPWVNRMGNRWWARRRLVKTIRANLMLLRIDRMFRTPIVFMTRHPCAVVLSRMRLKWDTHIEEFLAQPRLTEDHLDRYMPQIASSTTEVQRQAVMWCIENLIPLRSLESSGWIFTTYERLFCQPVIESSRILDQLGIRRTWFTNKSIKKITEMTRPDSYLLSGRNPLVEWQEKLETREIDDILRIVRSFGIELYNAESLPNFEVAKASLTPVKDHAQLIKDHPSGRLAKQ